MYVTTNNDVPMKSCEGCEHCIQHPGYYKPCACDLGAYSYKRGDIRVPEEQCPLHVKESKVKNKFTQFRLKMIDKAEKARREKLLKNV